MNLYTILAHAKDELRRAKDHEQTIRAIVEGPAQIFGKSADDRKRELALLLAKDNHYRSAVEMLRNTEHAVDMAQAAIDQAEQDRREREWSIRRIEADIERESNRIRVLELNRHDERPATRIRGDIDDLYGKPQAAPSLRIEEADERERRDYAWRIENEQ